MRAMRTGSLLPSSARTAPFSRPWARTALRPSSSMAGDCTSAAGPETAARRATRRCAVCTSVIVTNFLKFSEIPKSVPKFLPKFLPNIHREIFSARSNLRGALLSRAIQNVQNVHSMTEYYKNITLSSSFKPTRRGPGSYKHRKLETGSHPRGAGNGFGRP